MNKNKTTKKDIMVFLAFFTFVFIAVPLALLGTFYSDHRGTHSGGTIVNDKYFYKIAGKGIYQYTPGGESKRIIKNRDINAQYLINQDGVYQCDNKLIYFYDFKTEENSLFFDAEKYECSHISFTLMSDDNINIALHLTDNRKTRQLILESKTGKIIKPVTEPIEDPYFFRYSHTEFNIGNRHITKNYIKNPYSDSIWLLEENGENILPENMVVDDYSGHKSGDCLVFPFYSNDYSHQTGLLLLRADGNDEIVDIPYHYQWAIYEDYAYSISNYQYSELQCIDIHTGESWVLNDETHIIAAEITTDGNYIYTRDYHPQTQSCWEIIKDDSGKPVKAILIADNL